MTCVRCDSDAGLVLDGPLTLRLCAACHREWLASPQRSVIRGALFTFAVRAGWAWVNRGEPRLREVSDGG
jgi:hypothetical protein